MIVPDGCTAHAWPGPVLLAAGLQAAALALFQGPHSGAQAGGCAAPRVTTEGQRENETREAQSDLCGLCAR